MLTNGYGDLLNAEDLNKIEVVSDQFRMNNSEITQLPELVKPSFVLQKSVLTSIHVISPVNKLKMTAN